MSADNETITVGAEMPALGAIRHIRDFTVSVRWAAGARRGITEEVDLAPAILQFRVFTPLRTDPALFSSVRIDDDGATLVWGDGQIDMAATTVERLASDAMSNAEFRAFIDRHRLTLDAAGAVLGLSRRQVAYYAKDRPIPRLVALACTGYEAKQAGGGRAKFFGHRIG